MSLDPHRLEASRARLEPGLQGSGVGGKEELLVKQKLSDAQPTLCLTRSQSPFDLPCHPARVLECPFSCSDERAGVREMTSHLKRMLLQATPTHPCECPRCSGLPAEQRFHQA